MGENKRQESPVCTGPHQWGAWVYSYLASKPTTRYRTCAHCHLTETQDIMK